MTESSLTRRESRALSDWIKPRGKSILPSMVFGLLNTSRRYGAVYNIIENSISTTEEIYFKTYCESEKRVKFSVSSVLETTTTKLSQKVFGSSNIISTLDPARQQSDSLTSHPIAISVNDENDDDCSMNSDEIDAEWSRDDWIKVPDSVGGSVPRLIEFMREINLIK